MSRALAVTTLLYSQDYLPGVFTLGHQIQNLLKVCNISNIDSCLLVEETLYTNDLSSKIKNALNSLYNSIILINPLEENNWVIKNNNTNLDLLNRPELAFSLIKIKLWEQIKYDQILYLDADTLPLTTELFDLFNDFKSQTSLQIAASPDIGWPDIFNSGVMLIVPNKETYSQLLNFTIDNVSIDGADQGILNQFFNQNCKDGNNENNENNENNKTEWLPLSFLYNVTTPNTGYQCPPAMKFFSKKIKVIHFIGNNKPWKSIPDVDSINCNYQKEWYRIYYDYMNQTEINEKLIGLHIKESVNQEKNDNKINYPELKNSEPQKIDLPLQFKDWLTTFIMKEETPIEIPQNDNNYIPKISDNREPKMHNEEIIDNLNTTSSESSALQKKSSEQSKHNISVVPTSDPEPHYITNFKFEWEVTENQRKVQRIFPGDIFEYEVEQEQHESNEEPDLKWAVSSLHSKKNDKETNLQILEDANECEPAHCETYSVKKNIATAGYNPEEDVLLTRQFLDNDIFTAPAPIEEEYLSEDYVEE